MPVKVDWKRVKPEDFKYDSPKSNGSFDGFSVRVTVKDPETGSYVPFIHQAPKLTIPFGLKKKDNPSYGPRYLADFSFPTVRKNEEGEYSGEEEPLAYFKLIESINDMNLSKAVENTSVDPSRKDSVWFKKDYKREVLKEFYLSVLSYPREPQKYSPTFNTKIKFINNMFQTEFFNQKGSKIDFDSIGKGLQVIPIIEMPRLWFAGKNFGMVCKLVQLMVFERDQFRGCCIDPGYAIETTDLVAEAKAIVPTFNMPSEDKPLVIETGDSESAGDDDDDGDVHHRRSKRVRKN